MNKHTPSYKDTDWRATQMGSEGWAVFAGPRMIASNLNKANACLIAAAPDLLEAHKSVHDQLMADFRHGSLPVNFRQYTLSLANELCPAIRKAEENK